MNEYERHIRTLVKHGAKVMTAWGAQPLSVAWYYNILAFCQRYGINCLAYDMTVPDIDEKLMLAIWKNGHVDSGRPEHIHAIMDQEASV